MTRKICLPDPHPQFRPRLEGGLRQPGHPGTAVRIGEDLYEVVAVERSGQEWVYRLEPWTGQETIRVFVEWTEGSEREFAAGLRHDRIRQRKGVLAWAAQPFLGFLPARDQDRLYQERGLDPARATFWSAVLELAVASPFVLFFFISLFAGEMGGSGRSIPAWVGALAAVVLADGTFRLAAVISTGEPIGSLFTALFGLRLRAEGPRDLAGDEISEIGGALSILSPVPKIWWERAGGITYGGEPYILAGWDREKKQYTYRFRKGGEGFPMLDPELEKARNRSSDLSYVLAPLWGFLPADLQRALEFYGRYTPRPYVMISIGFNLLFALALVGPGLRNAARGVHTIPSLLLSAAALFLFTESALRLLRLLREGRISGSVLGFLLKPLYARTISEKPLPPA
jgi:hypothetical protein